MSAAHSTEPAAAGAAPTSEGEAAEAVALTSLWEDLSGLVGDHVRLVALELRRLRQMLARWVAVALVSAILMATAWFALVGLAIVLLVELGLPPAMVLAVVALLNALGGWLCMRRAQALLADLALPASLRRFTFAPPPSVPGAAPVVPPAPQGIQP